MRQACSLPDRAVCGVLLSDGGMDKQKIFSARLRGCRRRHLRAMLLYAARMLAGPAFFFLRDYARACSIFVKAQNSAGLLPAPSPFFFVSSEPCCCCAVCYRLSESSVLVLAKARARMLACHSHSLHAHRNWGLGLVGVGVARQLAEAPRIRG